MQQSCNVDQVTMLVQSKRLPKGFSLIEILVAMAIIALLAGIAVPFLSGDSDKYAQQEIRRLLVAINQVRDLAVIQNKEYGLNIDETGYQFLVLDEEDPDKPAKWQIIESDKALQAHEFVELVEVNVAIDGENIFKSQEEDVDIFEEDVDIFDSEEEEPKIEPPQIYFLSTGEQNQFTIAITSDRQNAPSDEALNFYRIQGRLNGELIFQGPLPGDIFQDIDRDYSDILESDQ